MAFSVFRFYFRRNNVTSLTKCVSFSTSLSYSSDNRKHVAPCTCLFCLQMRSFPLISPGFTRYGTKCSSVPTRTAAEEQSTEARQVCDQSRFVCLYYLYRSKKTVRTFASSILAVTFTWTRVTFNPDRATYYFQDNFVSSCWAWTTNCKIVIFI